MIWVLSKGDIVKAKEIEEMEVDIVFSWFYVTLVKELNELLYNIEVIKETKN